MIPAALRNRVVCAEVRSFLARLPDASIHCVVTSPPYWLQRDYRTPGQVGLEPTLQAYLDTQVEVFREVRRVLRADGTLWLNMGDGYNAHASGQDHQAHPERRRGRNAVGGLSHKDLLGLPWRLAFALQDDGWILRSDVIWHKRQCMPESTRDRPTRAHEYLFLFAKRPTYFYDQVAIMEPSTGNAHPRGNGVNPKARLPAGWQSDPGGHDRIPKGHYQSRQNASFSAAVHDTVSLRNARTVWTLTSQPLKEAHFATFPEALVRPCVRAGTSAKGVCPTCGAPWKRTTKRTLDTSTSWQPTCTCPPATPIPSVILDPYMGSGTVAVVALSEGRSFVGCDLNPAYVALAEARITRETGYWREWLGPAAAEVTDGEAAAG